MNQGFDEWYGIPNSSDQAFWPDSDSFQKDSGVEFTRVMSAKRDEEPEYLEVYNRKKRALIDREITTRALDFIDRNAKIGRPFFAYLPYTQTHEPVDAHPDFKGSTGNGSFADVLAQTDSYVGEILGKLEKLKLSKNTIVIFTSDNGREGVKRSFGFTGPWRGSMFSPYEGSLRVPFLIRYPQKVPSGQVSNEMVHIVDILPTLAKWTNSDLPKDRILDGVDQTNFLTGKTAKSSRETVLIYVGNDLFGVKWRNWKMLLKEIARNGSYAIQNLAYPSIFNLIVDPKEEEPEKFYLDDTWAEIPLWNAIEEHQISIEKDRGSPSS
jgi:arylsulfatase